MTPGALRPAQRPGNPRLAARPFVRLLIPWAMILLLTVSAHGEGELSLFPLGDFPLENGQVIRGCTLAYRTYGRLNEAKSNVLLFPTWLAGTSQDLISLGLVGPGRLADTERYHVVAVDAFGNGVSSSPSNSREQPGGTFPSFTIGDLVRAQHELVTRGLGVKVIRVIIGISMGGMQVFEWLVSFPGSVSLAVVVSGTPRPTAYDLLVWQSELAVLDALRQSGGVAMQALAPIHTLLGRTPAWFADRVARDAFPALLRSSEEALGRYNPDDWAAQVRAMMAHDVSRRFGGSMEKSAGRVTARTLVVVARQDQLVYPPISLEFARLVGGEKGELTGDCGHLAFLCEKERLSGIVEAFLKSDKPTPSGNANP